MKCISVNVFVSNFSITTVTAVSRRTSCRIFCVTRMMYSNIAIINEYDKCEDVE